MLDDYYYQTTGQHIKNLEDLYLNPTEVAFVASQLTGQVVVNEGDRK